MPANRLRRDDGDEMTATTARTSTRMTPLLFARQLQLLQLLDQGIEHQNAAHDVGEDHE